MRAALLLLFSLMGLTAARAADGPERGLADRINYRPPMVGEKITKENQAWANPLSSKKFEGTGDLDLKKDSGNLKSFETKKFSDSKFETRSFLGIKNPWFGNKVYDTGKKDQWAKDALNGKDNKFSVEQAVVKGYEPGKKEAVLNGGTVETKTFAERGKAQGALTDDQRKNLTIDDVREILNKNR